MTENIGSPFFWEFKEQRAIETLAKRGKATYNKPMEVAEQKTALENFFEQNVSTSANPAHIVGFEPVSPEPYMIPSSTSSTTSNDECEDDTELTDETVTKTEEKENETI